MCLRLKSENREFPIVNIYPIYEENDVDGRGCLTSVSCISHGSQLSTNGEFQVYLNIYLKKQKDF